MKNVNVVRRRLVDIVRGTNNNHVVVLLHCLTVHLRPTAVVQNNRLNDDMFLLHGYQLMFWTKP